MTRRPWGPSGRRRRALAAAPRQSRSRLRADVAYPLVRGGSGEWELRVTPTWAVRGFRREPAEVARLRASALTAGLFDPS